MKQKKVLPRLRKGESPNSEGKCLFFNPGGEIRRVDLDGDLESRVDAEMAGKISS